MAWINIREALLEKHHYNSSAAKLPDSKREVIGIVYKPLKVSRNLGLNIYTIVSGF